MNFIDKAIANKDNLSAEEFLQAMVGIYNEFEVWNQLCKNALDEFLYKVLYLFCL